MKIENFEEAQRTMGFLQKAERALYSIDSEDAIKRFSVEIHMAAGDTVFSFDDALLGECRKEIRRVLLQRIRILKTELRKLGMKVPA